MLNSKDADTTIIDTLRIVGGSGTVTINGDSESVPMLDDVYVIGASSVRVVIDANVSSLDNVTMNAGTVSVSSLIGTTARVFGGTLTVDGAASVTDLELWGGTVDYDSSGTLTGLFVYAGDFDGSGNTSDSVAITNAWLYIAGEIDVNSGLYNFTFTNPIMLYGGGTTIPPAYADVGRGSSPIPGASQ